ncbi:MAG: hypothetical protein R3A48_16490 [Polyangiales bacterium]
MTERAALALLLALGAGCKRRPPAPPVEVVATDVPASIDVPAPQDDPLDASEHDDATDAVDAPETAPPPRARSGPWRSLPRVDLTGVSLLGRWEDAPDRDGDEQSDPTVAVHWNTVAARCVPVSATRPCPRPDPRDLGPDARDGAYTVAYLTMYSGDAQGVDGGMALARVLGTRQLRRSSAMPRATLRGVEFTEFGGAVLARAEVEVVDGAGATDLIDVADLFVGAAGERHAGAMIHHCLSRAPGEATRGGSVAVSDAELVPLVHRAAMAHPFAGCAADLGPWEREVADTFSQGLTVTVTHDEPARPHTPRVGLAREPLRAVPWGSGDDQIPLRANGFELDRVDRVCRGDRVRWRVDGRRCSAVVRRDDAPLQGCAAPISPLDPTRAEAVALTAEAGGDATLLLTRGGEVLRVTLPRDCAHTHRLPEAVPHRGAVPAGATASPRGDLALFTRGMDLWLWARGREWPMLVNGPSSGLPRGTLRAMAFLDARTVAAVISTHLVTFSLALSDAALEPPDEVDLTAAELRGPR